MEAMKYGTFQAEQQIRMMRDQFEVNQQVPQENQLRADIDDEEDDDNVFAKSSLSSKWKGSYEQQGTWNEMDLEEFYLLATSIGGKGKDIVGEFEINGRIENGNVVFNKQYLGEHYMG